MPVIIVDQHNGKVHQFLGLYKCDSFEHLVQCTEPPGKDNISLGIFHEHDLTDKKMIEINQFVRINKWIRNLFKGKVYIQSNRFTAGKMCPFVRCLHDTGTSTSYNPKTFLSQQVSNFFGELVVIVTGLLPG